MDKLFNSGTGAGDGQFLKQRAELHDEGDLACSENLADTDGGDECQGYEHVCLDVECGHKSDHSFQDDGQAAKNKKFSKIRSFRL